MQANDYKISTLYEEFSVFQIDNFNMKLQYWYMYVTNSVICIDKFECPNFLYLASSSI
jgi:hypothetical protein